MRRGRVLYVDVKEAGLRIDASQRVLLMITRGKCSTRSPWESTGVHLRKASVLSAHKA